MAESAAFEFARTRAKYGKIESEMCINKAQLNLFGVKPVLNVSIGQMHTKVFKCQAFIEIRLSQLGICFQLKEFHCNSRSCQLCFEKIKQKTYILVIQLCSVSVLRICGANCILVVTQIRESKDQLFSYICEFERSSR